MKMRMLMAALALVLAVSGLAHAGGPHGLPDGDAASLGMSAEKLNAIPAKFQMFLDGKKLPGLITAVARDGKIVHFAAFGSMDVEREKPMREDTIFRMYSMTKPITGTAVMILVDEGKIALSDPLSKYIPEFADSQVLEVAEDGSTSLVPANKPITLEHLMTHTSGLVYGDEDSPVGKYYAEAELNTDGGGGDTLEETAKKAAGMPLVVHPGEQWNYSIAMDVLGRVVEVVTGERFGDFMHDRIFEPLGMNDSAFWVPAEKLERFSANYTPNRETGGMTLMDDPATSRYLKVPSQDSGGGGMVGTAADYIRFAQMLLNGGELDGVRIISEASAEAMTTNHLAPELGDSPLSTIMPGINFTGIGFGYCGAVILDGHDKTIFGGAGQYSWGGYASTDFWIDKNEGIVGLVLTQLAPTASYPTRPIMHNAVYDAIVESREAGGTD